MKRFFLISFLALAVPTEALCQGSAPSSIAVRRDAVKADSSPLTGSLFAYQSSAAVSDGAEGDDGVQAGNVEDDTRRRFWVSAEYLLWRIKGDKMPPLATTSSPFTGIISTNSMGILGRPGTTVLFGDSVLDRGRFSGGRVVAGFWLNANHTVGLEGSYFFLESRSINFSASSTGERGSQLISRPIINATNNQESATFVAVPVVGFSFSPRVASGSIIISSPTHLQGGEANFIYKPGTGGRMSTELLAGFRSLSLSEQLNIVTSTNYFEPASAGKPFLGPSGLMDKRDQFATRNNFFGGQVGARSRYSVRRLSIELSGKLALGANREGVVVNGSTSFQTRLGNPPRPTAFSFQGGVLALPTNIGHYRRNKFASLPEGSLRLGYKLTGALNAFAGYEILYLSNVLRAGEQIDRVVNPFRVPLEASFEINDVGPLRPSLSFKGSSFWAQGLTTGLRIDF